MITASNIVITTVLHRASRDWSNNEESSKRNSESNLYKHQTSTTPLRPSFSHISNLGTMDAVLANKRRTNAQVTRMLFAVTLSLILCNIPNTVFFIFVKIYDVRQILFGRSCTDVSDRDIQLYTFGFYTSVVQDILSDLPHIFNFFLYCLAGKKFRSIFIMEVTQFCMDIHLIKSKDRRFLNGKSFIQMDSMSTIHCNGTQKCKTPDAIPQRSRSSVEVLFNTNPKNTIGTEEKVALIENPKHTSVRIQKLTRSNTSES